MIASGISVVLSKKRMEQMYFGVCVCAMCVTRKRHKGFWFETLIRSNYGKKPVINISPETFQKAALPQITNVIHYNRCYQSQIENSCS